MNSKKGILGGIFMTVIATIVIILILLIFILGSGVIKSLKNFDGRSAVQEENSIGISNLEDYIELDYIRILEIRKNVLIGKNVEEVILEAQNG